jgi:eight-cysteine-cluster-containing protein
MRNIIYLVLLILTLLLLGCAVQEKQPVAKEEIECDAVKSCSEGYECVKLPDKAKPTCVLPEVLESDKYKDCRIAESYPPQIICPKTRPAGEGCESDADCKISGCNGEVCSSQEGVASICVYKPEFECYSLTNCKCTDSKCGWGQTEEFLNCIAGKR